MGIARLDISIQVLEELLKLPDGICIKEFLWTSIKDGYFTVLITGDALPTLDETNGEIERAHMELSKISHSFVSSSRLDVCGKTVASWDYLDKNRQ